MLPDSFAKKGAQMPPHRAITSPGAPWQTVSGVRCVQDPVQQVTKQSAKKQAHMIQNSVQAEHNEKWGFKNHQLLKVLMWVFMDPVLSMFTQK